jgi:hypothetical protein
LILIFWFCHQELERLITLPTSFANKSIPELPFDLETELEFAVATDPTWQVGLEWGQPRSGHPEGQVKYHIRDVLGNIDYFFGRDRNRSKLRLIALVHDTFKYQAASLKHKNRPPSHGYWARKFAEQYIHDQSILEVIELHDEAYLAARLLTRSGDAESAVKRARVLITRLDNNLDLFMQFYLCDNRTGAKSTTHYEWFSRVVEEHIRDRKS